MKHHSETDLLDGVQDAEPEPESTADQSAVERGGGPGEPGAHTRSTPEDLRPSGSAEAHGEYGYDPGVAGGEFAEEGKEGGPDSHEESNDEESD